MNRYQNNLTQWSAWPLRALFLIVGLSIAAGCASQPAPSSRTIYEAGLNTVRLEQDPDSTSNAHPATLTASGGRHVAPGGPRIGTAEHRSPPDFRSSRSNQGIPERRDRRVGVASFNSALSG